MSHFIRIIFKYQFYHLFGADLEQTFLLFLNAILTYLYVKGENYPEEICFKNV